MEEAFIFSTKLLLTLSWRRCLLYRNQSINLLCKSMDWFLYDRDLHHEKVKFRFEIHELKRVTAWKYDRSISHERVKTSEIKNYFKHLFNKYKWIRQHDILLKLTDIGLFFFLLWVIFLQLSCRDLKPAAFLVFIKFQRNFTDGDFIGKYKLAFNFNFFMMEVPIIYKPVHWFALQINGLVSMW